MMTKVKEIQVIKEIIFGFLFIILLIVSGCRKDEIPPSLIPEPRTIQVRNPGDGNDISVYLQAAFDSAAPHDILVLPEGTFKFERSLCFTRPVSLKGAGKDITILYRPESIPDNIISGKAFINYLLWRDTPSNIVISDITFRGKDPSIVNGDGKSLARDFGVQLSGVVDFVITRCKFMNFGEAGLNILHRDYLARGLIYNNEFYHNMKGEDGLGTGYGIAVRGQGLNWVDDPKYGTSNFIFIEDNKFDFHRHSVASGFCALYVARYNTMLNNLIGHAVDMHGTPNLGSISARASEIYNNILRNDYLKFYPGLVPLTGSPENTSLSYIGIAVRGGESLIYNNTIQGFRYAVAVRAEFESADTSPYPKYTQIGYKSALLYGSSDTGTDASHSDGDVFIWNNQFTEYNPDPAGGNLVLNLTQSFLKKDRDFHLVAKPNYTPFVYPHPNRLE